MTDSPVSPIRIDVWSDIACPWCYIGKTNLRLGLEETANDENPPRVEVTFHSYELSPDTPVDFEGSEVDYLASHRGVDAAAAQEMLDHVTEVARGSGLEYRFDLLHHTNTVEAHELLHYAKDKGLQDEVAEGLMRGYFVEGRHLGRTEELVQIATEAGLDAADVREALESHRYLDAVRADEQRAQQIGVTGVPFFVIDDKYAVSGAQPAEAFAQIARQVWGEHLTADTADAVAP